MMNCDGNWNLSWECWGSFGLSQTFCRQLWQCLAQKKIALPSIQQLLNKFSVKTSSLKLWSRNMTSKCSPTSSRAFLKQSFLSNRNWRKGKCNFHYSNTWLTKTSLIWFLLFDGVFAQKLSDVLKPMPTHARNKFFFCAQMLPLKTHLSLCTIITFGDKIMIQNDCL